jgi:hypothetical protein
LIAESEQLRKHATRTGRYNNAVKVFVLDVIPDLTDAFGTAQDVVRLTKVNTLFVGGLNQLINIKGLADITAFADIDTNLRFHDYLLAPMLMAFSAAPVAS